MGSYMLPFRSICAFVISGAVKTASASREIEAGIASFSQSALVIGVRVQLTTPWPNPRDRRIPQSSDCADGSQATAEAKPG